MKIILKVFATLRKNIPNNQELKIEDHTTVAELISSLDLQENAVSIIMINGRIVKKDALLQEHDTLSLFPPVGGG